MDYKNRMALILFSAMFWIVFGLFFAIYYFSGHMADWDTDWRSIMIAVMCCNFVVGPFLTYLAVNIFVLRS